MRQSKSTSTRGQGPALAAGALLACLQVSVAQGATEGEADARAATDAYASFEPFPGATQISDYRFDNPPRVEDTLGNGVVATSSSSAGLEGSPLSTAGSSAVGMAGAGRAGVAASVVVTSAGAYLNSGAGNAEAVASWWDGVVIDSAFNGQSGYLTATLILDGELFVQARDQTASNLERAFATLSILGEGLAPASGQATAGQCLPGAGYCVYAFAGAPNFSGGPANGYYEFGTLAVQIPFIFGEEFYVGYTLKAKATAQAISWDQFSLAGAATGAANFAHTLAWGGIDGVFLAGGTAVDEFTLESGSGFDYRTSAASVVPVPAAAWLLGSGVLWLAALARRPQSPIRVGLPASAQAA